MGQVKDLLGDGRDMDKQEEGGKMSEQEEGKRRYTIDELMKDREPGSIKITQGHWSADRWFAPYFKAKEVWWYGVDNTDTSDSYQIEVSNWTLWQRPKKKVIKYLWICGGALAANAAGFFRYYSEEEVEKWSDRYRTVKSWEKLEFTAKEFEE